ncbi:MAG: M50 family metallopeptidase [Bacillota bacterium]|nr:M50 family metallopeptidase [Bacillota bacterium]
MLYIIFGVLLFGLLIAVHEGGHFLAAKKLGVQVNEFAIGMGPALFTRQRGETLYSLRAFPIGGYCAMEGEDEKSDNPRAFSAKAPWKKIIILVAGSAFNFLAGLLLVALLLTSAGSYGVPVVKDFREGVSFAGEEGLLPGDRILEINGGRVRTCADVSAWLSAARGEPKDLVVERQGERVALYDLTIEPQTYEENGKTVTRYGINFQVEQATPLGVLAQSWNTCLYFARTVWQSLGMLVTGQVGLQEMSGPVGIVTYLGEAGSQSSSVAGGLRNVGYLIALIAVNLAVMNMLPIPALDGGRVFLLLVTEGWYLMTRRTIDPKYEAWLNGVGFLLLILLMILVTFSDVLKLVN